MHFYQFQTQEQDAVETELDWSKCVICQISTSDPLKCPANCPVAGAESVEETYRKFLENVTQFREIGSMPCNVPFGKNNLARFCDNSASWHKSCYLKFNNAKLQRARKRSMERDNVNAVPSAVDRSKRRCVGPEMCIFCLTGGNLHSFCTFDADRKVRKMVTELEDGTLMSRVGRW